jgi:hypothetical protein
MVRIIELTLELLTIFMTDTFVIFFLCDGLLMAPCCLPTFTKKLLQH